MILVGGQGTRLRPLTSTVAKPVVRLVDRPFISFMLEWLHGHGVEDVIMSCGFQADGVRAILGDGSQFGVCLRFVEEPEPRGTAGALKLAEPMLEERFLMLNGDVLTDLDLTEQIARHESAGAKATLSLVPVDDPSAYGVVLLDPDGAVSEFVEKPSPGTVDSNLISAGAYVLEREILELVPPDRNVSIEREVWPQLIGAGLHGYASERYWLDIGTPERYLQGTFDIMRAAVKTAVSERLGDGVLIEDGAQVLGETVGPVIVESGARIEYGATVGGLAVLAADASVGAGSTVERAVILEGAEIGQGCELRDCIVGPGARIGAASKITGCAVLGEGVDVGAGNVITRGARIFPGVQLPDGALDF